MDSAGFDANNTTADLFEESPLASGVPMLRGLLSTICIMGIAFNLLVLCKRRRETNRQASTTRIALRLLGFQTIADTISLVALLIPLSIQYVGIRDPDVMVVVCKTDLFLIHSSSAFSIWCWLIMSFVRYIAIYRPYAHLRLNKEPMLAVALVVGMCALFELWILYDVTYLEEVKGCAETLPPPWGQRLQLAEIAWSYFLPLVLITVLDIRVCCHSVWSRGPLVIADSDFQNGSMRRLRPNMSNDPICEMKKTSLYAKNSLALSTQSVSTDRPNLGVSPSMSFSEGVFDSPPALPSVSPLPSNGYSISLKSRSSARGPSRQKNSKRKAQMRILKRFLIISVLDLLMNLPNYLLRLTVVYDDSLLEFNSHVFTMIQDCSQLLYFAQFALNAIWYLIFTGPPKKPKTTSYPPCSSKSAA